LVVILSNYPLFPLRIQHRLLSNLALSTVDLFTFEKLVEVHYRAPLPIGTIIGKDPRPPGNEI